MRKDIAEQAAEMVLEAHTLLRGLLGEAEEAELEDEWLADVALATSRLVDVYENLTDLADVAEST